MDLKREVTLPWLSFGSALLRTNTASRSCLLFRASTDHLEFAKEQKLHICSSVPASASKSCTVASATPTRSSVSLPNYIDRAVMLLKSALILVSPRKLAAKARFAVYHRKRKCRYIINIRIAVSPFQAQRAQPHPMSRVHQLWSLLGAPPPHFGRHVAELRRVAITCASHLHAHSQSHRLVCAELASQHSVSI